MRVILLLLICCSVTFGYKILFYNPKFGPSHVSFTGKIADTLAAAGHEVVVYQPVFNDEINFTGTKNKTVRYYTMPKPDNLAFDVSSDETQNNIWEEESWAKIRKMMKMFTVKDEFCYMVLNDRENLEKLKAENFDLAITELFESCGLGIFKALGIKKHITTYGSSLFPASASLLGIKYHPSYIPGIMGGGSTDQMGYFQRVKNFLSYFTEYYFSKVMFVGGTEKAIQRHLPDFSMDESQADSAFYFVNSDEHVDYPQAISHKIVYIGGLGKVQARPLEKQYSEIFDSAKKGVILFSFGSNVKSAYMKPEYKKAFLEAFAEFPDINFLWKYENDDHQIAKGHKNVFTGKWLPQNDILDHPRLLAFITHGGMNSVIEGSTKGVPMICIPVFGDQKRNSFLVLRRGSSLILNKSDITKENVVAAIREIVNNPKYTENARALSKMVKAKPVSPEERVVKYAEFAAQFGDTGTLQTEGRYQSFFVLYSLDVIFGLLTALLIVLGLLVWVVRRLINFIRVKLWTKTVEKKKTQ